RYFVVIYPVRNDPHRVSTGGHQDFDWLGAMEFCQKIAAGEVTVAELQAKYDAEDAARRRAVELEGAKEAKAFLALLEADGLTYHKLLELEMLEHGLGEAGHQALLAYENGEGWPYEA
ncbi:MAG: hypothetical protein K2K53_10830, partial [Oscillospiraceae bacterium]|nr:hypothetical protein [Oscillospiraceae bacterium]